MPVLFALSTCVTLLWESCAWIKQGILEAADNRGVVDDGRLQQMEVEEGKGREVTAPVFMGMEGEASQRLHGTRS